MKTIKDLQKYKPCLDGLKYAISQPSLWDAWNNCTRSDWMWWLLTRKKVSKEISVAYANFCAAASVSAASVSAAIAAIDAIDAIDDAIDDVIDAAIYAAIDDAIDAADDADDADDAVYAAERKKQADFLRTIVPNPYASR